MNYFARFLLLATGVAILLGAAWLAAQVIMLAGGLL